LRVSPVLQKDFSNLDLLDSLYNSLNRSIPTGIHADEYLHEGLDARGLLITFRHKLLQLFKVLLLEPRYDVSDRLLIRLLSHMSQQVTQHVTARYDLAHLDASSSYATIMGTVATCHTLNHAL